MLAIKGKVKIDSRPMNKRTFKVIRKVVKMVRVNVNAHEFIFLTVYLKARYKFKSFDRFSMYNSSWEEKRIVSSENRRWVIDNTAEAVHN